jgi:glycogen debranching enzyme
METGLVLVDGSTFFASDRTGDTAGGENGLFFADTRHLSVWRLTVDGAPVRLLTCDTPQYYSARIHATLPTARVGLAPAVSVRRDRTLATGVHEDVVVDNHGGQDRELVVELAYGVDFADLFEVKDADVPRRVGSVNIEGDTVVFRYRCGGFTRATTLRFSEPGDLDGSRVRWRVRLPAHGRWSTCVDVSCTDNDGEHGPRVGHGGFGQLQPDMPLTVQRWLADAPVLQTGFDPAVHAYRQALLDLAALRFRPFRALEWSLPAAGAPWSMALFGRDSLITAYQALPFHPRLAATTLEALAAFQAGDVDDFRDAQPGKIPHELRRGELTASGRRPHSPSYGSHDATLLFLILLDEYERWTGDTALVRWLEPAARAAIGWLEGPADSDGDGYLEYRTRSPQGLVNQCWKDSGNSIMFADGRIAAPPIATCEMQGYAYDARRRTARLARTVWHDEDLADRLEWDAAQLRTRFNVDYWNPARGHFVLALDADKRQVDAATSNVGHLLWSGIIDQDHTESTAALLATPQLSTGWGIRTMSSTDRGYHPLGYHTGAVWPHDTAIVAEGLRRYGYQEQATELAVNLIEAAAGFDYRLPQLFAGFDRDQGSVPVAYPTASRPHAWAAGAVLLALRTLLGLDADDGRPRVSGERVTSVGPTLLSNIPVHGVRYSAQV